MSGDFGPFLQAAADEFAGQQVTAARAPLNAQIATLTGQLIAAQRQLDALKAAAPTALPLPAGWGKVAFFDDFTGTQPDGLKWNVRNNTFAKNELSIVTNRPSNVVLDGKVLTLRAQREAFTAGSTTRQFTSGYLDTIGRFSQQYGRWEIRAKLPPARGLWPAFWLRGNTGLGEIDIMEAVGGTGKVVQTVHQSTNGDLAKKGHESAVADLTGWHVFAVEREPGVVRWYTDDKLEFTVTTVDAPWLDITFNEPMNIRLNLQVGGSMPDYYKLGVDASTVFPADFVVDYVRVLTR